MAWRLHPGVVTTDTDDGRVLLDERTGRYWQLNPAGAAVLDRLLDGQQPEQVAVELASRYGIGPDRARLDVDAVVGKLRSARLVDPA